MSSMPFEIFNLHNFTINIKSQQEQSSKTFIDYNKQSYLIIGHILIYWITDAIS